MKLAANRMVREKLSLMMFPEGTRSRGKAMQKFKKGAFYLAKETGFPLLPVVASDYFASLNLGKYHSGKVLMEALSPIHVPKEIKSEALEQLMENTHREMKQAVERLNRELTG